MMGIDKKITPRLRMVASKVRQNSVALDIGTDHAYVPVFLIEKAICPFVYAGDVVRGPLKNAQTVVTEYQLQDKIELRLSDGLEAFSDVKVDDIIIAGMGGLLIAEILSKADWIKSPVIRLILQPMTHAEDVRQYLIQNGFELLEEDAVSEGKRPYMVMVAHYTGNAQKYADDFIYTGLLNDSENPAAKAYIKKQYDRLKKKADALQKISNFEEAERIYKLIEKFECND